MLVVGRVGRESITVVEWAKHSIAWGLVCSAWGAEVVLSISDTPKIRDLVRVMLPRSAVKSVLQTIVLTKVIYKSVDVFAGTVLDLNELRTIGQLIGKMSPKVVLISLSKTFSRNQVLKSVGYQRLSSLFRVHLRGLVHARIGGATGSEWRFLILVQRDVPGKGPHLVQGKVCNQDLFSIIDDTLGGGTSRRKPDVHARKPHQLGWDLSKCPNKREYWVEAPSVYSRTPILRRLADHELLALWDYPQPKTVKISPRLLSIFLDALLAGPPGKMIRKVAVEVLRMLWVPRYPKQFCAEPLTRVIPYEATSTSIQGVQEKHLNAAKADDEAVDISLWALPGETLLQQWSREILRRFAHIWWVRNLRREATFWL